MQRLQRLVGVVLVWKSLVFLRSCNFVARGLAVASVEVGVACDVRSPLLYPDQPSWC